MTNKCRTLNRVSELRAHYLDDINGGARQLEGGVGRHRGRA